MDDGVLQLLNLVSDDEILGPRGIAIFQEICPGSSDVIAYASDRCQIRSRNNNGGAEPVIPSTDEVRAEVAVITEETMNKIEQQRDEIVDLKREKVVLGRTNRDLDGRNRDLEGRNRDLGERNRDLEGRNRELEKANQELEAEVRQLKEMLLQVNGNLVHGYGIQETGHN